MQLKKWMCSSLSGTTWGIIECTISTCTKIKITDTDIFVTTKSDIFIIAKVQLQQDNCEESIKVDSF